jgi:Fibronectin type III domain
VCFDGLVSGLLCFHLMPSYRVSIRFSRLPDAELNIFADNVIVRMTGNPAYPTPLVPLSELTTLQQAFDAASIASNKGGQLATVAKNQCRAALLDALRRQASYVQGVNRDDLGQLLSSGYSAASRNTAQTQLAKPAITRILNEHTQKLTLRVTPVPNTRNYQVQIQVGQSEWQDAGIYSQARRIEVKNLTPGTAYTVRIRALGGSTGASDWSDPTSRMSL